MPISRTAKIIAQSGTSYYDSEYIATINGETHIPLSSTQFNIDTDYLEVRHENLVLEKNENYSITETGDYIDLLGWSLSIGDKIVFKVTKNINLYLDKTDGKLLKQNSVDNDKLGTDIKIGSLTGLLTTIKTSIMAAINELVGSIIAHKTNAMPHQFTDISTNTVYQYGLKVQDNHLIFSYQEVI